jgi:flagellar hook-basal body complex protein FliE
MTSPISGITIPSFPGISGLTGVGNTTAATAAGGAQSTSGGDFASILSSSLDQLQSTQSNADSLATQAATGNLSDVADYMVASNEASLATDTVVTLKNQAVAAFNQIMGMPV